MSKKKKRYKRIKEKTFASENRKDAIAQGFYDGRFRKRVVPNKKKKEETKKWKPEL